jgi:hypothetical protein
MLSIHLRLGLASDLFPSGFPTNNLYTFLFSLIRATCPAHLILFDHIFLFDLITGTDSPEQYVYSGSSISHHTCTSIAVSDINGHQDCLNN